jgi:hydroxymethylbilane synthase
MSQRPLRLGTRRSVLARAQSAAIASALEQHHPGLKVELVGIDTRGDQVTDVPLSQIDGKEFFTAEIDAALLRGEVDLTVHSFKDLSLERPAGVYLGAVPRRENPRDIVFFAPDILEHLARGGQVRIGSSSPRRAAFIPEFLQRALPGNPQVQRCELRGNVDSRLRRLRLARDSDRQLDAVVLAFAGVARLWKDQLVGAHALVAELLADVPRMLMPLTQSPGAPAQGALAIECRSEDATTRELLAAIDDAATRRSIAAERALLAARGGGCHQQFGATHRFVPELGALLYTREADHDGAREPQQAWEPLRALPLVSGPVHPWDGSAVPTPASVAIPQAAQRARAALAGAGAGFITHRRALPDLPAAAINACAHLWVPGVETWFALAQRGVWIEGCAEGLGFQDLESTLNAPLLALPPTTDWLVLTYEEALPHWIGSRALGTYRHEASAADAPAPDRSVTHVYWHSAAQFERWGDRLNAHVHHACGPGKTSERLREAGVAKLNVFPAARHWREWLGA